MNTSKDAEKAKKRFKKKNPVGYILGSVALFAVACVTIPVAMTKVTGILYKATNSADKDDDDDWGPVIEKKSLPKDTDTDEKDEEAL